MHACTWKATGLVNIVAPIPLAYVLLEELGNYAPVQDTIVRLTAVTITELERSFPIMLGVSAKHNDSGGNIAP